MNKNLWPAALVAIASLLVSVVTAQTPVPASSPVGATPLDVRGCVRRAVDIHAKGEAGLALSDPDTATQFVLVRTPTKADAPVASTGGARGTFRAVGASIYRLDDMSAVQLSPHVGHEVEISGTLISEEHHASTGAAPNVASPKVAVNALTMIASSCPNEP